VVADFHTGASVDVEIDAHPAALSPAERGHAALSPPEGGLAAP
jgi:hypothetical protein